VQLREEAGGDAGLTLLHRMIDGHNKRKMNKANQQFRQAKGDAELDNLDTEDGEESVGR
tara:strand:- start:100 stop:276 length:177 start_codon:yes stop_codon:yes gene_type:complete